jgi:hypothetical protein
MKKDETEKMVKSDSTIITNCAEIRDNGITRKEALQKAGKYAAFTAAAAVLLLAPKKAMAYSAPTDLGSGGAGWGSSSGGGVPGASGGGIGSNSPFSRPESTSNSSGLRDSPWK